MKERVLIILIVSSFYNLKLKSNATFNSFDPFCVLIS